MQVFWLVGFIFFLPVDIVLTQLSERVHALVHPSFICCFIL